jgi:hypothetical protein
VEESVGIDSFVVGIVMVMTMLGPVLCTLEYATEGGNPLRHAACVPLIGVVLPSHQYPG